MLNYPPHFTKRLVMNYSTLPCPTCRRSFRGFPLNEQLLKCIYTKELVAYTLDEGGYMLCYSPDVILVNERGECRFHSLFFSDGSTYEICFSDGPRTGHFRIQIGTWSSEQYANSLAEQYIENKGW